MQKKIILVAAALILVLGMYYIVINNRANPTSTFSPEESAQTGESESTQPSNQNNIAPTSTSGTSSTQNSAPKSIAIDIRNFSYTPATLAVKAGTKVTWTNYDNSPHTVTSDSGGLLDSPTLSPGQSFSFTFTDEVSIRYHCTFHPQMKGTVNVSN